MEVEGAADIEVEMVFDPPWSPDMINEIARLGWVSRAERSLVGARRGDFCLSKSQLAKGDLLNGTIPRCYSSDRDI